MSAWRIEVPPNEMLPRWYGVAYYRFEYNAVVAMPIPLNLVVSGWRALVVWLRFPPWRSYAQRIDHIERTAYADGFEAGRLYSAFDDVLGIRR